MESQVLSMNGRAAQVHLSSLNRSRFIRVPIVLGVLIAAMLSAWAGLVRIGWSLPLASADLLMAHGPLMVCGALMALIGFERAVALQGRCGDWLFAAPVFAVLGTLGLIGGLPTTLGALLFTTSSAILFAIHIVMLRLQPAAFTRVMTAGAALLLIGNVLWASGWPLFRVAPGWIGFLVLTIAGERLELGRVQRLSRKAILAFVISALVLCGGILASIIAPDPGVRMMGLGLLALAGWLLRYDVARRTVRTTGLPRFIGACLLSGYIWLGAGGGLSMAFGALSGGPRYDAVLHTVFVGFVFSMIFGHAPIILPALLGGAVTPLRQFYLPLAVLHASLTIRVIADLAGLVALRRWGGLLNVVALLMYAAVMIYAVRQARYTARSDGGRS